jgi:hypothetical protein
MFGIYNSIKQIYNDLDTRTKRCLYIDIYSILYIILPFKLYSKEKYIYMWLFSLFIIIVKVKGKKGTYLTSNDHSYKLNKIKFSKNVH